MTDSQNRIYAMLRLRIPSSVFHINSPLFRILKNSSIIRELHVYGPATDLGDKGRVQHRGLGERLLLEAEKITRSEYRLPKIAVISGIGVRGYYRKHGYVLKQGYMVKELG